MTARRRRGAPRRPPAPATLPDGWRLETDGADCALLRPDGTVRAAWRQIAGDPLPSAIAIATGPDDGPQSSAAAPRRESGRNKSTTEQRVAVSAPCVQSEDGGAS